MRNFTKIFLVALLCQPVAAEQVHVASIAYHDVRDDINRNYDKDEFGVSTANLAAHFQWLRLNGYSVIGVDDILAARSGTRALPEKPVLLTFDDGLTSVYTHVYPLLKLFNYKAVASVVTSWIGTGGVVTYDHRELDDGGFLNWDQIREMQQSGLVEIGSHTHDLHKGIHSNPQGNETPAAVTRWYRDEGYETDSDYENRIRADLALSVEIIRQNTGVAPRLITWPYGANSYVTREIAAELGMHVTLTLEERERDHGHSIAVGRKLAVANPDIEDLSYLLFSPDTPPIVRAARVSLDDVYAPDVEQQEANLGRLLDRIRTLEISHVFLSAWADPDGDGVAQALYFPNRNLPMRANLFSRVAWQLETRANVEVFASLPLLAYSGNRLNLATPVLPDETNATDDSSHATARLSPFDPVARRMITEIFDDLGKYADFDGVHFGADGYLAPGEDNASHSLAAYRAELGEDFSVDMAVSDPELMSRLGKVKRDALTELSVQLIETVRRYRPHVLTARSLRPEAVLSANGETAYAQSVAAYLANYDLITIGTQAATGHQSAGPEYLHRLVQSLGLEPGALPRTVLEISTRDPISGKRLASTDLKRRLRALQGRGVRNLSYDSDDFLADHPGVAELKAGISLAEFPWEQSR